MDGRHATESTIRYRRQRIFFIEGGRQAVGFEIPLNPLTAHLFLSFLSGDFRVSIDRHQPLLESVKPFIYGDAAHSMCSAVRSVIVADRIDIWAHTGRPQNSGNRSCGDFPFRGLSRERERSLPGGGGAPQGRSGSPRPLRICSFEVIRRAACPLQPARFSERNGFDPVAPASSTLSGLTI